MGRKQRLRLFANKKKPHLKLKKINLERVMGFEPTASTLARSRSTPELHPLAYRIDKIFIKRRGEKASLKLLNPNLDQRHFIPVRLALAFGMYDNQNIGAGADDAVNRIGNLGRHKVFARFLIFIDQLE